MHNLILSSHTTEELTGIIIQAVREAVTAIQAIPTPSTSETLLTRRETADKLKVSLVTLNDWTRRGMIQSHIIGGRVLYKASEVEKALHPVKSVKY
jgi:excisionase family DNA binding protein